MRNLSCFLSSISIHAFAIALVTAAGVFESPDFAVTSGGVSITGSQSQVEIETRIEFTEPQPVEITEAIPASDPFQIALPDTATEAASHQKPAPPAVKLPAAPARSAARQSPLVIVETLSIPRDGLLERIGEAARQSGSSQKIPLGDSPKSLAQSEAANSQADFETETESVPEPVRETEPAEKRLQPEKPNQSSENSRRDSETVETKPVQNSASARETQRPAPATNQQKSSTAAPASNEPPGAKVDQLPSKLATNPSPDYPRDAWLKQQEGVVYLLVQVSEAGLADSVKVYRSSGVQSLDEAAGKSVRGWKFQPALRAGRPVACPIVVPMRFRIQKQ